MHARFCVRSVAFYPVPVCSACLRWAGKTGSWNASAIHRPARACFHTSIAFRRCGARWKSCAGQLVKTQPGKEPACRKYRLPVSIPCPVFAQTVYSYQQDSEAPPLILFSLCLFPAYKLSAGAALLLNSADLANALHMERQPRLR